MSKKNLSRVYLLKEDNATLKTISAIKDKTMIDMMHEIIIFYLRENSKELCDSLENKNLDIRLVYTQDVSLEKKQQ